eukprot:COSAG04_NODE_142_length_23587_cov_115.049295_4_plen_186_part_00
MKKYRMICLLNHSFKLLSAYLLRRTTVEVEASLPDEQAGFRKDRGTRDNILLLARIIDNTLARGEEGVAVFLDYEACSKAYAGLAAAEIERTAGNDVQQAVPGRGEQATNRIHLGARPFGQQRQRQSRPAGTMGQGTRAIQPHPATRRDAREERIERSDEEKDCRREEAEGGVQRRAAGGGDSST